MNYLKAELREKINEEIAALPGDYISASDNGLLLRVMLLKEFIAARNIMVYCSVKREPATWGIIEAAMSMGKTVAFPLCYRGGLMDARSVSDLRELRPAMLGIPAPPDTAPVMPPEELDLIIVPALAYDKSGYRLGYGGGYYDRFLCNIRAFTVGVARERLIMEELPREPHDIAVKCLITECETRISSAPDDP